MFSSSRFPVGRIEILDHEMLGAVAASIKGGREGGKGGASTRASKNHCCWAKSLKFKKRPSLVFIRVMLWSPLGVAPQPAVLRMTTNSRQKTHYGGRPGSSCFRNKITRSWSTCSFWGFERTSVKYDSCAERSPQRSGGQWPHEEKEKVEGCCKGLGESTKLFSYWF